MEGLLRTYQETKEPKYKEAADRAMAWLKSQALPEGELRRQAGKPDTRIYILRADCMIGNQQGVDYWTAAGRDWNWKTGQERTHYFAYALEGLLSTNKHGIVRPMLEASRKAILTSGFYAYWVSQGWECGDDGGDAVATAQMACLFMRCGLDATGLVASVRSCVEKDGGVWLSALDHRKASWSAKFYLDMEKLCANLAFPSLLASTTGLTSRSRSSQASGKTSRKRKSSS